MSQHTHSIQFNSNQRMGMVAVQVLLMLGVLLGFAALSVDVGNLYVAKGELQNAADSAALAGASAFGDDALRTAAGASLDDDAWIMVAREAATGRAYGYCKLNTATGKHVLLEQMDVRVGHFDFDKPKDPVSFFGGGRPNAVRVTARFTEDSANGAVANFFAQILGFKQTDVEALGVAAFDDRMIGYTPGGTSNLIPFAIQEDTYDNMRTGGTDDYGFDSSSESITNFSDGSPEISLFPVKSAAGNWGKLNIGTGNQGAPEVEQQILNGVTPEDIELETGYSELTFGDGDGHPSTYEVTGNPGITNGLIPAFESKIGQVVAFFLYSKAVDNGANAVYTITGIRFGRVMAVRMTGKLELRAIYIQPVISADEGVRVDASAPSTDGMVGRLLLVR